MSKLTAKQEAFIQEYVIDKNATQAAIRAGYSQKTAGQIGDELIEGGAFLSGIKITEQDLGA